MAFTLADLVAIQRAIASGARTVQFSDRSTTYRSLAELRAAERIISESLAVPTPPKQFLGYSDKGF